MSGSVECVVGLGRKGGGCPVVLNFMTFYKETASVKHVRNLAGTVIHIEDFSTEMREVWNTLISLFERCKKMGLQSLLEKRQTINGQIHNLSYLRKQM
jgi:flagellar biosynthesis/type III secretory pathway chaperone